MREQVILTGMVIKSAPAGEYDRRLVILTCERGKITAFARGARRPGSTLMAASAPFVFGTFALYEGRDAYSLVSVDVQNYFREITEDMEAACYGSYFLEFADYYGRENLEAVETLKLLYQSLRALLKSAIPNRLVRAVFELKLMEIKMGRILKFNSDKSNEFIAQTLEQIAKINDKLEHIVDYTIDWFTMLKEKYGKAYPRHTVIRNFDTIEATKVVEANEKLYINRQEGFIGMGLKKDEFICNCSDIDDVIIFYRNGTYKIVKVADKIFIGKDILYVNVFKRNDNRTIYNVIYRDGKFGYNYIKRFAVTGATRDREYDLTKGTENSRVLYFSANPNGEAETVKVILKPKPRQKLLVFEKNFSEIAIKGRGSQGNILTKAEVHKISLKQKGSSTLGGREVWFDWDVLRLNYDGRGEELGEFHSNDQILVILPNGDFYVTNFDLSNHYESNIMVIEKYQPSKIWTAVLYDADQKYYYIKRFLLEVNTRKQNFLGENPKNRLMLLTDEVYPRIEVIFGGHDAFREALVLDADEFIAVKGFKAKGKRISTFEVETINELEPNRFVPSENASESDDTEGNEEGNDTDDGQSTTDIIDEITGQMKLFDE